MKIITEFIEKAELILYPSYCKICGTALSPGERVICKNCVDKFPFHQGPKCPICGKPYFSQTAKSIVCGECRKGRPFKVHRSGGLYEGNLKDTIILYKYMGYENLSKQLAEFLTLRIEDVWDADCIVPLPAHKRRLRERGFDHTKTLAKEVGKIKNIRVISLLKRVKYTPPQAGLSKSQRLTNPRGSFAIKGLSSCKKVILLDDVWTTGSTISEASRVLSRAGYEVFAITIARTV